VHKKELKMRIENLLQIRRDKKDRAIGIMVTAAVFITVITTLIYGNLNDSTKQQFLAEVNHEYSVRAPEATRVEIEKVPSHLITALMVHEDSEFYEHNGLRLISVFRAAGANTKSLFSGKGFYRNGGSTITQQLAKQFINDPKRSLKRKFKELRIARVLEQNFSKNDIMEMYLNMIYFGNNTYGLKAASEKYFGHDYEKMTLNESAMIVPFIDAPSLYNVLKDPTTAQNRQLLLLRKIALANV
jgi:penicillin-binding protein 2A